MLRAEGSIRGQVPWILIWPMALGMAAGCSQAPLNVREDLAKASPIASTASPSDVTVNRAGATRPAMSQDPGRQDGSMNPLPAALEAPREPAAPGPVPVEVAPVDPNAAELDAIAASGRPLDLPAAIDLAFRLQPRLRAQIEGIRQAAGRREVVGSFFLPTAVASGSVGGFEVNSGGSVSTKGLNLPSNFNFLPGTGFVPFGFHTNTGYELVDLNVQWLITDFGRRLGRYEQAKLALDVAQLQSERAYQTVANEVSQAYYDVLKGQALRRTAVESAHRAEETLIDARKLQREGVIERDAVLRAEVLRAEVRQQLNASAEAEFVALAALNLAIGIKCNEPLRVVEPPEPPPFVRSLSDCLTDAIRGRREFQVARRGVEIAQEGTSVARAEFAPKITANGSLIDLRQAASGGHSDIALGNIRVEWELFEGGRRVAEKQVADSRLREAMAQAESIADSIAFQVNSAYRGVITARLGIDDARPAVAQAGENYRIVRIRAREGNATPLELTDAEALLTRAQQSYQASLYAYFSALARMDHATGDGPTPTTLVRRSH